MIKLSSSRVPEDKQFASIQKLTKEAQARRKVVLAHGRKMYEELHGRGSYDNDHSFFERVERLTRDLKLEKS